MCSASHNMSGEQVFQFSSSTSLERLTGHKASNLEELLKLIKECADSSIFYHTFSAFRKLREVHVPYANGFAMWISRDLNEEALAEKLATIDLTEYNTIAILRSRIVETIETYRTERPEAFQKNAHKPFYLLDVMRIAYLTDKFAYDLKSFREILDTISIDSLYFHFIESRLYTHLESDDFSTWIKESLNLRTLATEIRRIDIMVYTLDELREKMTEIIDEYMAQAPS